MYPYKSGESNTSFLARSGVIRDQLAKQIPSVDAFPNGRPKLPSGVISPYNEEAEVNGRWTAPARRTGHEGIMQKGDTENPSFRSVDLTPAKAPSRFMSVIGVASGNSLEMYDFMIFGYYAKWIARAFFPLHNPVSSLLLTLATFGAGFLMRPLGAVLLGGYTDRHGRRAGLLLTLSLMAVGTATIALTPSYSTIGLIAPLIVVTGRLLQGLSAGAELGTASVYLAEIAPEGWKGLYVSLQSASQQVAVMAAAILGILLAKYLPEDSLDRWGWRLPLVVGCALIPFLFWIRQSMAETSPLSKRVLSGRQVLSSLAQNWRIVLIATFFTALTTTAFYFITVYTLTFGVSELRLASRDALTVTLFVGLLNVIVLPLMGRVSDSLGRRALLWPASVCFLISAYPAIHWLVAGPSFGRLMAVELWLPFSMRATTLQWSSTLPRSCLRKSAQRASRLPIAWQRRSSVGLHPSYVRTSSRKPATKRHPACGYLSLRLLPSVRLP